MPYRYILNYVCNTLGDIVNLNNVPMSFELAQSVFTVVLQLLMLMLQSERLLLMLLLQSECCGNCHQWRPENADLLHLQERLRLLTHEENELKNRKKTII